MAIILKHGFLILIFCLVGTLFLAGGVAATLNTTMSTASCEACGMEIEKVELSSFKIVTLDGVEHWGCCPICAMVEGVHYDDCVLEAKCFECGETITIIIENGALTSDYDDSVRVIVGGSCMKNKIVCSSSCAETVKQTYDWATSAPEKNLKEAMSIANTKLSSMTVSYKAVKIPELNFVLIGIGGALLVTTVITWRFSKKTI